MEGRKNREGEAQNQEKEFSHIQTVTLTKVILSMIKGMVREFLETKRTILYLKDCGVAIRSSENEREK